MNLFFEHTISPPHYSWSLKPFSIEINKGSITLLEGDNGSGKSNFLKILSGILLPQYSFSSFLSSHKEIEGISGFYQPISFDPQLTIEKNINLWGQSPLSKNPGDSLNRFLQELYLNQHRKILWSAASSGTKQKLGLAIAFSIEADFYFLDEPYAHVDEKSGKVISKLIEEKLKQKAAILVTSHHNKKPLPNFDYHYIIQEGTIYTI